MLFHLFNPVTLCICIALSYPHSSNSDPIDDKRYIRRKNAGSKHSLEAKTSLAKIDEVTRQRELQSLPTKQPTLSPNDDNYWDPSMLDSVLEDNYWDPSMLDSLLSPPSSRSPVSVSPISSQSSRILSLPPSAKPTVSPSIKPTDVPTVAPFVTPTSKPTKTPTIPPSTSSPTTAPTKKKPVHAELVYPGSDGRLVYVEHNNKREGQLVNTIPDFSYCGYQGGGVAIPTVGTDTDQIPIKITLFPQPNGIDRARIQNAINYVSSLPPDEHGFRGAVLLKAGLYHVDDDMIEGEAALLLNVSGVVLRGEGQGSNNELSQSTTVLKTSVEFMHEIIRIDNRRTRLRYLEINSTRINDAYVGTGAMKFTVENPTLFTVGEVVHVKFTPNEKWLSDIYANTWMKGDSIHWTTSDYSINYERTITHIVNNTVHIHSPIVQPMQTKYGGGEVHKLVKRRSFEQRLTQIGIENLRLEGPGVTPTLSTTSKHRLVDAIMIQYSESCWVRNVTSLHASNSAVQIVRSQYITVEDSAYLKPEGPINGGFRYSFYIHRNATHNLVQRTFTENGRHDYVTGPMTPGVNVFLDGYANLAWSDSGPHQRWATGTLFDSIKVTNHPNDIDDSALVVEHRGGGGSGHGWAGAQQVFWNTESPVVVCDAPRGHRSYAIGVIGQEAMSEKVDNSKMGVYRGHYDSLGTHVALRSLYLAQLQDRLGREAVKSVTTESQRQGFIWDELYERYHVD